MVPANVFCAVKIPIIHLLANLVALTTHFLGRLATPEIVDISIDRTWSSAALAKVRPLNAGEIPVSARSYLFKLLTALIVAVVVLNSTCDGFHSASLVRLSDDNFRCRQQSVSSTVLNNTDHAY